MFRMIVFEQPGIWKPDRLCLTHNINTALCILYVDKEKGINEIIRIVLHLESKKSSKITPHLETDTFLKICYVLFEDGVILKDS